VSDFSPDFDPDRGYTLTRTFDAPRALVWRAITEADLFAQWVGADTPMEVHTWDLRPGGEWRGTMTYEGNELPWSGRFIEIEEPERLVVAFTDEPTIEQVDETLTYTLTERGDQTELVLRQSGGSLSDEEYGPAREGTASFLEKMAEVVAGLRT
jgi:uncharacterized protein YndB with AHSA1/START domain